MVMLAQAFPDEGGSMVVLLNGTCTVLSISSCTLQECGSAQLCSGRRDGTDAMHDICMHWLFWFA